MNTHLKLSFLPICLLGLCTFAFAAAQTPDFTPEPCPKSVEATKCGYVRVPADHAAPDGKTIQLFVSINQGSEAGAIDPVFFLTGGPGEVSGPYAGLLGASQIYGDRDFITFDQRGAGLSKPALECPAYDAFVSEPTLSFDEAEATRQLGILETCGANLQENNVDLSIFNATQSAADVESIRQALGYNKINLVGGSYGTRLAQEVMRSFPKNLRAVVLDSVIPPPIDRPVNTVASAQRAYDRFMRACRTDRRCQRTYPNLEQVYTRLIARLEKTPLKVNFGGERTDLDGDTLSALVFGSLYFPVTIAELPGLIYKLSNGDVDALENSTVVAIFESLDNGGLTWGDFYAVECRGEIAYSDPAALTRAYETYPQWRSSLGTAVGISSPKMPKLCAAWGLTEPSGKENDPLKSNVPTLLLAGHFDPVTPPENLKLAAQSLSHAYSYIFPDQAHGAGLQSPCALGIVQAFITDPNTAPDSSCIKQAASIFAPKQGQ